MSVRVQHGVLQGVQSHNIQGQHNTSYCICGKPYSPTGEFMIECDICRDWFHGSCVNVKVYQSEDIDKYHCPKCAVAYGPSIYKEETNDHRHDRYEINANRKPMQSGTRAFVTHLLSRVFPSDSHYIVMEASNFTEAYLKEKGFNKPLLFESAVGLDLKVPNAASFNIKSIERHCNSSRELDVIESHKQSNCKMLLGDFIEYFTDPDRTKVLNVLSFEFSNTQMSMLVQPPLMARQLDWVRVVWPLGGSSHHPPPFVQKYCIMSAAGSYTDFHIDFGGSTVWYHILHGQKIFYLVPPTPSNLALYQQWSSSANQSEVFFGDLVESCTPCTLKKGQTLFIPTGWIHAVYTPEDSLVFGGNFLHSLNIELQLQINEIEKLIDTPMMYKFPSFETIHWYAGAHLLQRLRRINEEQQDKDFTISDRGKEGHETPTRALLDLPPYLVHGVRVLADALKDWNARKSYDPSKKENIPDSINSGQLVRELARELRRLERLLPPATAIQVTAARKKKKRTKYSDANVADERHFAVVSETEESSSFGIQNPRFKNKKSIKLTLLKSVTHAPAPPVDSNNLFTNSSQDSDDAELTNIASMACRSGMASYNPNYDSQDSFGGGDDDYRVPDDVKPKREDLYADQSGSAYKGPSVLKIKLDPSSGYIKSSPVHNQGPPPDYATTEHSILKTHLLSNQQSGQRHIKSSNQWTISKSQAKGTTNDSSEEQILFTNENLSMPGTSQISYSNSNVAYDANGVIYSPSVYNNENVHVETLPETYEPDYDVVDRKRTLPDYSPTKSMGEYVGAKVVSDKKTGNNFANNSDPYAQVTGSDSTGLSENEEYRLVQNNGKTVIIQKNVIGYANNDSYEFYEGNNRVQDYQVTPGSKKRISLMYDATTNSNSSAESHLSRPPPSYESSVSQSTRRTDRPSRRRVDHRSSIYDYEDLDEVHLCIDEDPRPPPNKKRKSKPQTEKALKMAQGQAYREVGRHQNSFGVPKNGIESLLQASAYTGSSDNQEREAVVGMLTIGQSYGLAKSDGSSKRIAHVEAPPIRAVHRDKDFVYTSLDMSSDDEEEIVAHRSRMPKRRMPLSTPSGGTDREDESWSPRGRLGRLTPRLNRPSRRGSRREAVQAALRAARNRGNSSDESHAPPAVVRAASVSPPSPVAPPPPPYSQQAAVVPHRPVQPYSVVRKPSRKKRAMKVLRPTPFQPNYSPTANKTTMKFKKGMKTAKQRLGKILKIHKMIG